MTNLEVTLTRRPATAAEIADHNDREERTNRIGLTLLQAPTYRYDVSVNSAIVATTYSDAFAKLYARRVQTWVIAWNASRSSVAV